MLAREQVRSFLLYPIWKQSNKSVTLADELITLRNRLSAVAAADSDDLFVQRIQAHRGLSKHSQKWYRELLQDQQILHVGQNF